MKRLIICCDGTWDAPDQSANGLPAPTNVFKLSNCVVRGEANGIEQLVYYHTGVGSTGNRIQQWLGGAMGIGITRHICSAYHWLALNYEEGDEIFLFGFSRGAFCVRSLASFLDYGLLDLVGLSPKEGWHRVHQTFSSGYREKLHDTTQWAEPTWRFFHNGSPPEIQFLGVWDTVGALGIPDTLRFTNIFDRPSHWQFFDTELKPHIKTARHAMSLDEMRASFTVTRWINCPTHGDCKEVWFPGVHADVGGGYGRSGLADCALLWMMEEAAQAGLILKTGIKKQLSPDPLSILHNSYQGFFAKLPSRPRNIPEICTENNQLFHPGVFQRQHSPLVNYPPYRPSTLLAPKQSITITIHAATPWNYTGIYLKRVAHYTFREAEEWQDKKDVCDWAGEWQQSLTPGNLVRKAVPWLKRARKLPWFVLVGAITNDGEKEVAVPNDGSPVDHQYEQLSLYQEKPLVLQQSGYLYCFANDARRFYTNNHGSIELTITRVD